LAADICAINAMGAHALPVLTVMTAQDNNRVHRVQAVAPEWLRLQAQVLIETIPVAAVKIGIIGSLANALVLADVIAALRVRQPDLPVVLDPVLGSGQGDPLAQEDPVQIIQPLLRWASVILPNRPEAARLAAGIQGIESQAQFLLQAGCAAVLLTGGHADDQADQQADQQANEQANATQVVNHWFAPNEYQRWQWPRLPGEFHGSGCTLASALAAALALQLPQPALRAQNFTQAALAGAYAVADGQLMPARVSPWRQEDV
jgi:hydroxymethylpyrimidine/phosphomethylpyrimidine kinase